MRPAHPTSPHGPNTWQKNILSLSAPPINQNLPTRQPLPGPVGCVIRTTPLPEAGKTIPQLQPQKTTATTTPFNLPIGAPGAPYIPAWTKHLAKNILSLSAPPTYQNLPTRPPLPGTVGCVIRTASLPEAGKKHLTATTSKKNCNHYSAQPAHRCV